MRWCSISGEPRHDQAGTFLGYRGAGRDLTEQLEAQREVELQGLALQAILQAMPDGVQLVDKSDGLLAVNDQIYEILEIPNRRAADAMPVDLSIDPRSRPARRIRARAIPRRWRANAASCCAR